jgi:hypothetical protein
MTEIVDPWPRQYVAGCATEEYFAQRAAGGAGPYGSWITKPTLPSGKWDETGRRRFTTAAMP